MLTFYKTLFFLILFLLKTQLVYPQWVQTDGLHSGSIMCSAVSGTNIFVGTYAYGVYLLTNNGTNWIPANNDLTNTTVYALTVSGNNIFAGTNGSGIWMRPLSDLVDISKEVNVLPLDYTLFQNYPNPFNPSTTISYRLKEKGFVKIKVYDITGNLIKVLVNETKEHSYYETEFSAKRLASSVYFYKLEILDKNNVSVYSDMKKCVLIK